MSLRLRACRCLSCSGAHRSLVSKSDSETDEVSESSSELLSDRPAASISRRRFLRNLARRARKEAPSPTLLPSWAGRVRGVRGEVRCGNVRWVCACARSREFGGLGALEEEGARGCPGGGGGVGAGGGGSTSSSSSAMCASRLSNCEGTCTVCMQRLAAPSASVLRVCGDSDEGSVGCQQPSASTARKMRCPGAECEAAACDSMMRAASAPWSRMTIATSKRVEMASSTICGRVRT